jgi:hypothetical protein
MQYGTKPVSVFIRKFLLGTSQGVTCLIFCALYFVADVLALASSEPSVWRLGLGFTFQGPLLLVAFVVLETGWGGRRNPRPKSSIPMTILIIVLGVLPFTYGYLHDRWIALAGVLGVPDDLDVLGLGYVAFVGWLLGFGESSVPIYDQTIDDIQRMLQFSESAQGRRGFSDFLVLGYGGLLGAVIRVGRGAIDHLKTRYGS